MKLQDAYIMASGSIAIDDENIEAAATMIRYAQDQALECAARTLEIQAPGHGAVAEIRALKNEQPERKPDLFDNLTALQEQIEKTLFSLGTKITP